MQPFRSGIHGVPQSVVMTVRLESTSGPVIPASDLLPSTGTSLSLRGVVRFRRTLRNDSFASGRFIASGRPSAIGAQTGIPAWFASMARCSAEMSLYP